jgi:hypothetical protein
VHWEYSPDLDGDPDPGEVVWAWVAYEEDDSVGKDRPIAVVGRTDDRRLVALMLSSRDHRGDRDWVSIGSGPWDREGRESWVRKDRILAVAVAAVRREGAILPKPAYDGLVSGIRGASARPVSARADADRAAAATGGLVGRLRRLLGRPTGRS